MTDKIIITSSRYIDGQDKVVETIYRATGWTLVKEKDENNYPILNILKNNDIIATHRTWDNVRRAEDDPIEKVVIID